MRLASFKGTRPGIYGVFSAITRIRLKGVYSHNEIVFEPGDGVDLWMPDGTCEPDEKGALWCVSSTGLERLPAWSKRRAGRRGGVRFKRIVLDDQWDQVRCAQDARFAAQWALDNEGMLYDWQLILGFVAWVFPHKKDRVACYEACGKMMGIGSEAWRLDPCSLPLFAGVRA